MAKTASKIAPWNPGSLAVVEARTVEWSKGFLRCQPLRWFPDLDRDWRTFCLGLGWEASIQRIEPSLVVPSYAQERFFASCQGEPLAIVLEKHAAAQLGEMFFQSPLAPIRALGLSYLGRRLTARMGKAWVGGEPLRLLVDTDLTALDSFFAASIQFSMRVNARSIEGAFLLGPRMIGLLDGLWRRQLRAGTQTDLAAGSWSLLAAELKVLPLELPKLLSPGNVISLDKTSGGDFSLMRSAHSSNNSGGSNSSGNRIPVHVYAGDDNTFVVKAVGISELAPPLGAQFSRVSFVFGEVALDPVSQAELHQVGAYAETRIPLSAEVAVLVAGEPAGRALLGLNGDNGLVATVF